MKPIFLKDNRYNDAVPTATTTDPDFDVENITDERSFTFWKAADLTQQDIDVAGPGTADAIGIASHNLAGLDCEVYSSEDGGAWTLRHSFTPADNSVILQAFNTHTAAYGWRLRIPIATEAAYLAVLQIGARLSMPRFPVGDFTPERIKQHKETTKGKTGHRLGALIQYREVDIKATFKYIDPDWYHATLEPFIEANAGTQLFFGWDVTEWPKKVIYGELGEKLAPRYGKTPGVEVDIAINGKR